MQPGRTQLRPGRVSCNQAMNECADDCRNFDELEHRSAWLNALRPAPAEDDLGLQRGKEALGYTVIPAVADAAHADDGVVCRKLATVIATCVLATAVGVMK